MVPVARSGSGLGGVVVYMIQCDRRGAFSPMSTRIVYAGGKVSKFRTTILAAASARSFSRMFACALILWRAVWKPANLMVFEEVRDAS